MTLMEVPVDRLADHYVNYLFDQYPHHKHVRRVASWIGLVLTGLESAGVEKLGVRNRRQIGFEFGGRSFKAKYDHAVGSRGGVAIVEILEGQGSPEGETVIEIESLEAAEKFHDNSGSVLAKFIGRTKP